ncbi:unnamed protein product [Tuber melanosporum]|uniref:(Perigord truffle) hypothetical protein n=1 Tax=Tuber melanosporum (strain Mel28) TaxID=656061 RepID=D5GDF6_TUBMM|nr:uncharacterized protein GSTUM_00006191001 [Tuber melanosporum]CAZ82549.1 unnamed protein product [Tuber melanosporum]
MAEEGGWISVRLFQFRDSKFVLGLLEPQMRVPRPTGR